jgi:hypothetical protein
MFAVNDEVKIVKNNQGVMWDKAIGVIGIIERIDSAGIWVSAYDLDNNIEYLCDEDELELRVYEETK